MALRNQPYLPLYVDDFLADEKLSLCSAESTGVYIRLMCLMHKADEYGVILLKQKFKQSSKQILNFASMFARQMPYQIDVIERSLQELLDENVVILEGDRLIQKRMVKDENLSNIRASAGRKGGKKTQTKTNNFAKAKSEANTVIGIVSVNEDVIDIKKRGSGGKDFDAFWSSYPKKVGKQAARKAFEKVKVETDVLIAAIEAQKKSAQWQKAGGQYIPNPSTWLNEADGKMN